MDEQGKNSSPSIKSPIIVDEPSQPRQKNQGGKRLPKKSRRDRDVGAKYP